MTEKLYYKDSHLFEFEASVLECRSTEKEHICILNQTAFFPRGGGQDADTGRIGTVKVLDVKESNGEILHYTDAPLEAGKQYHCVLDREQRLCRMQNHSGEHVFSGLVHKHFGFENVGFHMGEEFMTLDFSGELSWEQLLELEEEANRVIRSNIPVLTGFPDDETLKNLEYRSKLELTHDIRIVEIPDVDICACCAPHVERTGEIGCERVLDCMRHRGGTRVLLVCGMDALRKEAVYRQNIRSISGQLSVPRENTADAVAKLLEEKQLLKEKIAALNMELVQFKAEAIEHSSRNICLFENALDDVGQRELVNLLMEKTDCVAAVFAGSDESGYRYIIGSKHVDLRSVSKTINVGIQGRGGGKPSMIQGSATAPASVILDYFEETVF